LFIILGIAILAIVAIAFLNIKYKKNNEDIVAEENDDAEEIVFDSKILNLLDMNSDEFIEWIKNNGENEYAYLDKTSDDEVKMSITNKQQMYWNTFIDEKISKENSKIKNVNSKFDIKCSENYQIINLYYNMSMESKTAFSYVSNLTMYCAIYQIFNGEQSYTINLNIYNSDTGKIVANGNLLTDDVSYDNTEWEESYTLTDEEIKNFISLNDNINEIKFKSTFADSISVIDIFSTANDGEYEYMYIDSEYKIHIGLNNQQKDEIINNLQNYIKKIESQFSNLENGYDIIYNEDYSKLDLYFNSNLSKQDQTNYFTYAETICMCLQLMTSNKDDYYIDINIYDSNTQKLISSGNTKSGISWNI
jgi:hypothetical protein